MKGKLKSVREKAAADSYVKRDSMVLRENSDLFLYHTVTKTARAKDSDSGSDSGSSTHTSASGATHGGGSGKF